MKKRVENFLEEFVPYRLIRTTYKMVKKQMKVNQDVFLTYEHPECLLPYHKSGQNILCNFLGRNSGLTNF